MQTHTRRDLHQLTRKRPAKKLPGMARECLDPIRCLGLTPDRVRKTTELHFGGRKIHELHDNFALFVNLEILWLNDNCLTEVRGLVPNHCGSDSRAERTIGTRRLRKLMLSNNKLTTVSGDIQSLKYLEVLLLSGNNLRNMEAICNQLCQLKSLRQLNLFDNPLAEEVNYRLYVIHKLPAVEILDRHQVTQRERKQSAALFTSTAGIHTAAFGKCLPFDSFQPTKIEFMNKTWSRIFHLSPSGKGVFDLQRNHIIKLAEKGTQVHIRMKELPGKSVTSKPGTYPIMRLREGRCLSCLENGQPATKKDVEEAWEGCSFKNHLWSKTEISSDRPISTCLYDTPGNPQGLQLICPSVGPGNKCGWTPSSVDPIEVYVDVGIAGEEKPNPMSMSVVHLQSQVVQIRAAALKEAYASKDKHNNALATQLATRSQFHETWTRRLGKSDFQATHKPEDSPEVIQGKKDLIHALEILKKNTSEEAVSNAYREIHEGSNVVSCLYKNVEGGHHFSPDEPFVPNRDSDCFASEYQKYLEANKDKILEKEQEDRLKVCYSQSQLSALANSIGNGDMESASVAKTNASSLLKLCLPQIANTEPITLSAASIEDLFADSDSIPLRTFLLWLTHQPNFLTRLSEVCRLQAAEDLSNGRHEKALAHQKTINTISEYLKPDLGERRPVGWLFDGPVDAKHIKTSQKKKKEVRVGSPDCMTPGSPPEVSSLPPSGYNPRFGSVGAGVDNLIGKYARREVARQCITAALIIALLPVVSVRSTIRTEQPPWS